MDKKVVLVLVDGMRPDGIEKCNNPFLIDLAKESTYSFKASAVMPSVTLPCHASLFLSVNPDRHGITTNTWMPQVRPIDSIGDAVHKAGKKVAMVYNWEELRDLNCPDHLFFSHFERPHGTNEEILAHEVEMTKIAINCIDRLAPDLMFLYLGATDGAGHTYGWLSEEYLRTVDNASNCIKRLKAALPENYQLIITADHGGHERSHGSDIPEDMTIPLICHGEDFEPNKEIDGMNLKDIAPTIAKILDVKCPTEWEGKAIS